MPFMICCECPVSCSIETHSNKLKPAFCGPDEQGMMRGCRWLIPPTHEIQTPIMDKVIPAKK